MQPAQAGFVRLLSFSVGECTRYQESLAPGRIVADTFSIRLDSGVNAKLDPEQVIRIGCGLRASSRFWLRLSEAKRLMLNERLDAARAAFHIGYERPSLFSREYSRLFGAPPKRDIDGWRRRADDRTACQGRVSA